MGANPPAGTTTFTITKEQLAAMRERVQAGIHEIAKLLRGPTPRPLEDGEDGEDGTGVYIYNASFVACCRKEHRSRKSKGRTLIRFGAPLC